MRQLGQNDGLASQMLLHVLVVHFQQVEYLDGYLECVQNEDYNLQIYKVLSVSTCEICAVDV